MPTDNQHISLRRVYPAGATKNALWTTMQYDGTSGRLPRLNNLLRIETGKAYGIWLDPSTSSPNAYVGVHFGDPGHAVYLLPGEGVEVPDGESFDHIYTWNAMSARFALINGVSAITDLMWGYCAFLVADRPGARPVGWDRRNMRPSNVGLLAHIDSPPTSTPALGTDVFVSTAGLRGLRITALPVVSGSVNPPSDLAGTIRLYRVIRGLGTGASPASQAPNSDETLETLGITTTVVPDQEGDMVLSQYNITFDREIVAADSAIAVGFAPGASPTGTNLNHVGIEIEGY